MTGWPRHARRWTPAEILRDAQLAREEFRRRRFGEPRSRYLASVEKFERANEWLLPRLHTLMASDGMSAEHAAQLLAEILSEETRATALRYIGGPPISLDDLKTLTDSTLSRAAIVGNPEIAQTLREVLRAVVDIKRFPWIEERRRPTPRERFGAVLASSVLAGAQRVHTARRGDERELVEGAVRGLLIGLGFSEAAKKPMQGIQRLRTRAPGAGQFMRSVTLGADNADLAIGLLDGRTLALECKGSNSEINSRKRLNKEAAKNARAWSAKFGEEVVPAAAIQGIFKSTYVAEAQDTPMVIFWGHRLDDLKSFIEAAR
jgi:hypothetical protein